LKFGFSIFEQAAMHDVVFLSEMERQEERRLRIERGYG
jgi:hypothetical protein